MTDRKSEQSFARRLVLALGVLLAYGAVFAAPAQAGFGFLTSWGTPTLHDGQFVIPSGVAVRGGNVYVISMGGDQVQRFDSTGAFLGKWGGYGTGDGQLDRPTGLTTDTAGNVYVADTFNHRIQKFNSTGTFLGKWGSYGTGDGQLNAPTGVAADTAGHVYVADTENNRIQRFSSTGTYQAQWGGPGSDEVQFSYPAAVATDAADDVYVADKYNNRVQKFDSDGNFLRMWGFGVDDGIDTFQTCTPATVPCQAGISGAGDGQLNQPTGIATDSAGDVHVTDSINQRIQKFSAAGAILGKWGSHGAGDGEFRFWPGFFAGIAADAAGNVYAVDDGNSRVQKFDSTAGTFLTKWGAAPSADGELTLAGEIAIGNGGEVYVADAGHDSIQKFSSTGAFLGKWGTFGTGDGQLDSPLGVATDAAGNVYVADTFNSRIQKFTSTGAFLGKWGSLGTGDSEFAAPTGVATDVAGNVYVADSANNRVQKFSPTGTFLGKWGSPGTGNGEFDNPRGVTTDASGNVYVPDSGNNRVQKFTSAGAFLMEWGTAGLGEGQFDHPGAFAGGIATDAAGNVYVADSGNNRVQKFSSTGVFLDKWGSPGTGDGEFRFPGPDDIAVDAAGNVYVTDTGNGRVEKFGESGSPVVSEPSPALDTTAPSVRLRIPKRQRLLRRRAVTVIAECSETCQLTASGKLSASKAKSPRRVEAAGAIRLRKNTRVLAAGTPKKLKLRLSKKAVSATRRALARHKRVRARVTAVAKDSAGNTGSARRTARIRR